MTSVELKVDVLEKGTLSVRLPEGARLFNTFVNGEGVSVVREGDAYLFHVAANAEGDRSADVRLVYASYSAGTQQRRISRTRGTKPEHSLGKRDVAGRDSARLQEPARIIKVDCSMHEEITAGMLVWH